MKIINKLGLFALLSFIFLPLSTIAADINQVDTNTQQQIRQQERERLLRQQQEVKPDAREAGQLLKNAAPTATDVITENETPCFIINQIELVGDSGDQFKFALNKVLVDEPIIGRCLGAIGINAVMVRVQNAIIAKGFVATRLLAAPQDKLILAYLTN